MVEDPAVVDTLLEQRILEAIQSEDLRFPRQAIYVLGGILVGWLAFWELCERVQENPHAQTMAWLFIFVAVYLVYTF